MFNDSLEDIADMDLDQQKPTETDISRAACAWVNTKDTPDFDGSQCLYFKHNWRSLPGLRKFVEAEVKARLDHYNGNGVNI